MLGADGSDRLHQSVARARVAGRTENSCEDGGAHVVDHGARADASERADVERGESADHRAHDERQDDHPEQPHEQLSREREVRLYAAIALHFRLVPLAAAHRAHAYSTRVQILEHL